MKAAKYVDDSGNTILAYTTTVPNIVVIPPNKTAEDAIPLSVKEFKNLPRKRQKPRRTIDSLQDEIEELKKQMRQLQKGNKA